jgi:hypothetical protein
MSDFINYLQHRVEEARRDLQGAQERMRQAIADQDMLTAELRGYEQALAAEMRRQGMAPIAVASQDQLTLTDVVQEETGVNKAEFARNFIRDHADTGVTPGDIFRGFKDARIPIGRAYVYSIIQRLQSSRPPAIKSRRGKWYPVPESEQSANGTAERVLS